MTATVPSEAAPVRLALVGEPAWWDASGQRQLLSRKDAALLALLAMDGAQTRDRLAELLWPEVPARTANANLRQRVHRLRRATGHAVVELADVVRLAPGLGCDIDAPSHAGWQTLGEHADRLLGPFEYDDNDALAAWVATMRGRWQLRRADILAGESALLEGQGALAGAIKLAERAVALAPQQEHAWRRLMRLHYLRGDRAAAIDTFERCERHLRHELGARPDRETVELLALVERADASPHGAAAQRPLPAALLRPPQLVGRDACWQAMERAWAGHRPWLLLAPAGFGKSRLWADFLHGRAGVVAVRARAGDGQTPYALFARALEQALADHAVVLPASQRRELARLLPSLGAAPAAAGQQGVLWHAAEAALVRCCAAGLAILAVDDLQFADQASVDLLRWLSGSTALPGLRLALAARPDDGATAWRTLGPWLGDSSRPETVSLQPWTAAEVAQLLASLALPELDEPTLAAALHRHAGGHPFFTLETLKAHVQQRPGPGAPLAQPASALALLDTRLDSLDADALGLLQLAAVVGGTLDPALLAELAGRSVLELAPRWLALEQAGLLRGAELAHDLVREAVLRRLTAPIAAVLHGQVARALEQSGATQPARVAMHWQAAGRWHEAAVAYQAAGLAARQAGRLREQAELLDAACDAAARAGDERRCFEVLLAGLDSALIRGGGQAMLAQTQRLQAWARSPRQQAQVLMARADAMLNLARPADALAAAQAALPVAQQESDLAHDLWCLLGQALGQSGRHEEALAALRQAEARVATPVQRLHVQSAKSFVCQAAQRPADALGAQQAALDLALEIGDTAEAALAQGNLATLHALLGAPAAAHTHALAARRSHADLGSPEGVHAAINLVNLGQAAAWCGRLEEALDTLHEAVRLLGPHTGAAAYTKARLALAGLQWALGRDDEARHSVASLPPDAPPAMALQWHLLKARLGDTGACQNAKALVAAQPVVLEQAAVWRLWADVADARAAAAQLARLRQRSLAAGMHAVSRSLALSEALLRTRFDAEQALALARQASAEAEAGLLPTVWPPEACWVLAQAQLCCGEPPERAVAQGCAWFERAGAPPGAPLWRALRALPVTPG